uniref:Uncharacterized protein n=1 Tax=Nelumbo nucifera TaxID=4432 RepID=A0A822XPL0_NELNU|nr:TPA_asm: hypothetical protein HUJ06_022319 [Nelumbo nucifera]
MEAAKSKSSIEELVEKIKDEIFSSSLDLYTLISPCAYDTAWLAMIPHPDQHLDRPTFQQCLDWILSNQNDARFWGDSNGRDNIPSIDCLPATLACMVSLVAWNVGANNVEKGIVIKVLKTDLK